MDNLLTQTPHITLDSDKLSFRAEQIRRFSDTDLLKNFIHQAGREAVLDHKSNGVSISAWQDGKLVTVQPEDIEVPKE